MTVNSYPTWGLDYRWVFESDLKYYHLRPTSLKRPVAFISLSESFRQCFLVSVLSRSGLVCTSSLFLFTHGVVMLVYTYKKCDFSTLWLSLNPSLSAKFLDGKVASIYNVLTTRMSRIVGRLPPRVLHLLQFAKLESLNLAEKLIRWYSFVCLDFSGYFYAFRLQWHIE